MVSAIMVIGTMTKMPSRWQYPVYILSIREAACSKRTSPFAAINPVHRVCQQCLPGTDGP